MGQKSETSVVTHRFKGLTALVTGAGRGIGLGCAQALAREGADVVLVSRTQTELDLAVDAIGRAGGRARGLECDVTKPEAVTDLFDRLARCDVLINNAGANAPQPFLEVDVATLDRLLTLNVRSMFLVAQAAARLMARERRGAIVHMSSQMGHVGGPNRTVYCMTKHAIEGLTKAMAIDLAPLGIRVNTIAPTYIETPMTKPFLDDPKFRDDTLRRIPIGRLGTIEEVVAATLFLAAPEASLITGTSLLVDGGYTAQ